MNWDQVVAQDAAYAQKWLDEYPFLPAPGGENFEDFGRRIQGAINAIADEIAGGSAVVVTHGGVIRTFRGYLAGPGRNPANFPTCDYASRWEVVREHDQWRWLSKLTSSAETAGVSQ
jgi:broad specificity phosphatase PhoE